MSTITVLMSTYNGEKYLKEQIESLLGQIGVDIRIFVRDDGSTDFTKKLLEEYQSVGILEWYSGKNLRSAKSFLDLVIRAPESEYYAFCDQDDVWNKDKLYRAVEALKKEGDIKIPRLYCSDYQVVDAGLNNLPDNGHVSTCTFGAALVSSCCTGCTTVFNRSLLEILQREIPEHLVMHDDWAHKVCLAVGGTVYYDEYKGLKYRQHGANVDGGVHGIRGRVKKIIQRMRSKDRIRSEQIKELIRIYGKLMPKHNLIMAMRVANYCNTGLINRIHLINDKEIRTPYERLNRGYKVAIIFKYF